MRDLVSSTLDAPTISTIVDGRHGDPFAVLGPNEIAALGQAQTVHYVCNRVRFTFDCGPTLLVPVVARGEKIASKVDRARVTGYYLRHRL
jgi:hypothetical protein